jgi:hypothetical protein
MAATIGPDDLDIHERPQPGLLQKISGLRPVEKGTHVLLEGARSTQRLAAREIGGAVWLALWPAELKEHAVYLYGNGLARPMISAALSEGWTATAAPQLAFRNSPAVLRLYMGPDIDPLEYARRWEDGDLAWVGAYRRQDVSQTLWPWLKSRGYVTDDDDAVLEEWLASRLGKRAAFLRAGLRLKRRCGPGASPADLRAEINAIFAAAQEPPLGG